MILSTARDWVRRAVTDAADNSLYTDADVDRAIQQAGHYFCRQTRSLTRRDTVAIAGANENFPLTTPIANGFRPERFMSCYLVGFADPLTVVDYEALNAAAADDASAGTPRALAFLDSATAAVWPVPDIAYTAKLRYWLAFTDWTPGTGSPGGVTFNIPDDYLPSILSDGAAAVLTSPNKENRFGTAAGQRFLAYVKSMAGAGCLGTKAIYRDKLED